MNSFSERYKGHSNADLLRIIENQNDYQTDAVGAARNELENRNLSEQEFNEAINQLEIEKEEKRIQLEKLAELETRAKNFFSSVIETIQPIQKPKVKTGRIVKLTAIVFGLIAGLKWYNNFDYTQFILIHGATLWDINTIEYLFIPILLPLAVVLFWMQKKSGWILLASYCSYSVVVSIGLLFYTWFFLPVWDDDFYNFYPEMSPVPHLNGLFFFGLTLWGLTYKDIKVLFLVTNKTAIATVALSAIASIILLYYYL